MKVIDSSELSLVYGGVDKNSEAYKIGEDVGEAIRKVGEVAGLVALGIGAFLTGND